MSLFIVCKKSIWRYPRSNFEKKCIIRLTVYFSLSYRQCLLNLQLWSNAFPRSANPVEALMSTDSQLSQSYTRHTHPSQLDVLYQAHKGSKIFFFILFFLKSVDKILTLSSGVNSIYCSKSMEFIRSKFKCKK